MALPPEAAGTHDTLDTRRALKSHALQLLARREHSRAELARKLASRLRRNARAGAADTAAGADLSPPADDEAVDRLIAGLLDDLQRAGLLSDQRAADTLVQAKAPRYGSRRIEQWLRTRALPPELIRSTVAKSRADEYPRALAVWQRRFGSAPLDLREKARQQRFLLARGFDGSVVDRVLRCAGRMDED